MLARQHRSLVLLLSVRYITPKSVVHRTQEDVLCLKIFQRSFADNFPRYFDVITINCDYVIELIMQHLKYDVSY